MTVVLPWTPAWQMLNILVLIAMIAVIVYLTRKRNKGVSSWQSIKHFLENG